MRLKSLTLRNFRNVPEATLEADPHLNFLIGANGQGKTSFLEGLSYLATLRSFRGAKSEEVVKWGETASEVHGALADGDWRTDLKIVFSLNQQSGMAPTSAKKGHARSSKIAFINGKGFRSSTQYLSQRFGSYELGFHTVIFNPADHDLVRGEPALRRGYLDRVLAAEDHEYLELIHKYQRVLLQRNTLLKEPYSPSPELLLGFSEPLAALGSRLTHKRLGWLERLKVRLNSVLHEIAPSLPNLELIYTSNWVPAIQNLASPNNTLGNVHFAGQLALPSLENLEQDFWKQLSLMNEAELRAQSSLVGPHRDDWAFLLGGQVLKGHGSQGEVRSALLALKLCEIELFRTQTGHRPLLLLDDFSSELDREKRAFLLRFLTDTDLQTFVTTTEDSFQVGKRFTVSQGMLTQQILPGSATASAAQTE